MVLDRFYHFVRSQASCADISLLGSALGRNLDPLYVRHDDLFCSVVSVTDIIPGSSFLTADMTNCHFSLLDSLHI